MKNLATRDREIIWHPYTQMQTAALPIGIVRGEGSLLYAESGDVYLDAVSSWWVNIHGHSHPYIAEKIAQQVKTLDHVIFAGFTHQPAVELAEKLLTILPQNQRRIFYSDNGSTAVEVALKMAIQYWENAGTPKRRIIAFRDSYHGDTFGAMSVSSRSAFTQPFVQYLFEVDFLDVPVVGKEQLVLSQIEEILKNNAVAAFIFEPLLLGTAGMVMYQPAILDELLEICQKHNVITIADEVMTGFGRTGRNFATDYLKNKPDIMCFSKGLTGGVMALGVTSCTAAIYEAFLSDNPGKTFFHGHSFTANPIACATALASLDLFVEDSCQNNIKRICQQHEQFRAQIAHHPILKECRQLGTVLALEFNAGETSYFNNIRQKLYQFALDNQVILRPLGNIIYVMPPYCTTNAQLAQIYQVVSGMLTLMAEN
ncbi:adenosylmethionine--8-amino-7-oxononanoate transaminase [Adhaeribacter radiodurans]|uniref:Adenosylmethionine-8-amino-7-oxononanoate aminotransferase n=1 Tax=Adhaeribacter radiodurans TaxID=2745197 RepID=A0A7L7L3U0_9BACT|nr:adenosylmethionine--8-amino-7-oxononanoate transaminase [Adhaeribacter radiodurans]QMU27491.1 adenosylmethionine--8-amino-7-oxononanoate transaminase [Adhaeribacter radiodurans]